MFKQYNFENNVRDNCSVKAVTLIFLLLSFFLSSFARKKTHYYYSFIYKIQDTRYKNFISDNRNIT